MKSKEYDVPLISVIVPVFNTEKKHLKKCLDSLFEQTYENTEIIIINDGSTEKETKRTIEEYSSTNNFKILNLKTNQGVSNARNLGFKEAKGEYIVYIDSDDYISKDYLEKMYHCLLTRKVSLVFPGFTHTSNGKLLNKTSIKNQAINLQDNLSLFLNNNREFGIHGALFKKSIAEKVKFDERLRFGEDVIYSFNLLIDNVAYYLGFNQYFYNRTGNSVTVFRNIEDAEKYLKDTYSTLLYFKEKTNDISKPEIGNIMLDKTEYAASSLLANSDCSSNRIIKFIKIAKKKYIKNEDDSTKRDVKASKIKIIKQSLITNNHLLAYCALVKTISLIKAFNLTTLIQLVLLAFIFKPIGLHDYPTVSTVFNIGKIVSILFIGFMYFKKRRIPSAPVFLLAAYIGYIFVVSYFYKTDSSQFINQTTSIIGIAMFLDYYLGNGNTKILKIIENYILLLLIINLATLNTNLFIDDNHFLGIRTRFSDPVLAIIGLAIANNLILSKKPIKLVFSILVALANIVVVSVSTSIAGIAIFGIVYLLMTLLRKKDRLRKAHLGIVISTMSLAASLSIVFLRIQTIAAPIIEKILHKSITFTGRTYIWDSAIEYIKKSPIIGQGYTHQGVATYNGRIWQAHNQILETVIEGGAIALLLLAAFVTTCYSKLSRNNKLYALLFSMLATMIFLCTFERYAFYSYFFILPFMAYYSKTITSGIREND